MPKVTYATYSPYYTTPQNEFFLLHYNHRKIPRDGTDETIIIDNKYQYRPDLLAYDRYGNPGLWWIFASHNPDILIDPIWDFKAGLEIICPTRQRVTNFI